MQNVSEKNEKRYRLLLNMAGWAVVLLVMMGFHLFVYQPLVSQREENAARIEQLDKLLTQSGAVQSEHRRLRDQLTTMLEAVATVHGRLPSEGLEDEFVNDLGRIAGEVGVEIEDHQLAPESRSLTHSETAVSIRGYGSYASICHFLQNVDQLARITKVSQIEVSSRKKRKGYRFQATFVLYYGAKTGDIHEKRRVL